MKGIGLLTLISALFGIAIALQHVRDASFPPPAIENDAALYLTSGQSVRRLSVAYQALAADVYWIRAIQHYGGTKRAIAGETIEETTIDRFRVNPKIDPKKFEAPK